MDTLLTALGIVVVMMMGCALYVLIWEAVDKKKGINLESGVQQKIIGYLNTDDKDEITEFVEQTVHDYLKDK